MINRGFLLLLLLLVDGSEGKDDSYFLSSRKGRKSGKKGGGQKEGKKGSSPISAPTPSPEEIFPDPFDPQPTFTSSDGKLEVTLHIGAAGEDFGFPNFMATEANGGGFQANVIGYSGCYSNGKAPCDDVNLMMGGPTLRVKPGDQLVIHLYNDLPKPACKTSGDIDFWNKFHQVHNTNIHVHGLFVPNQENNVLDVVYPGESVTYDIKIREIQQGGTHWYHPHAEGAVSFQAGGGAAGFIIVEDLEDDIPSEIASLPEIPMRIQYTDWTYLSGCPAADNDWDWQGAEKDCNYEDTTFDVTKSYVDSCITSCSKEEVDCGCDNPETDCVEPIFGVRPYSGVYSQALTVNGAENPEFEIYAEQWYRIRSLFVPSYKKAIEPFLDGCDFKLLSKDGRYMPVTPRDIESGYMFSGSRADFLVRCMNIGEYKFESIDEVPRPDNWATWNGTSMENSLPASSAIVGQKWDAWTGTMATFKVVESPHEPEVDEISQFKPALPCYTPEMRDLTVDDHYFFLQSGMAPPDDVLDGETYPVFRGETPPWPPVDDKTSPYSIFNDYVGEGTTTAWPGGLSPPKGSECDGKRTNEFGECYGKPPLGQDFTFTIGDIVEIDYYAPQIHPLHIHVFGYQITHLPEFAVKNDYFQVGDFHDTLLVPISGDDDPTELEAPEYGKVVFRQHIYQYETDLLVHCHFYRHSDSGMVQLGNTKGVVGASSPQVEGTCYTGLSDRAFEYA